MTGHEAVALIAKLGLSKARAGRIIGVSPASVNKWTNGGAVSVPVARLLRLLEARPELVDVLERIETS